MNIKWINPVLNANKLRMQNFPYYNFYIIDFPYIRHLHRRFGYSSYLKFTLLHINNEIIHNYTIIHSH